MPGITKNVPRDAAYFIRKHWRDMTRKEIADYLGVALSTVYVYAQLLNLRREKQHNRKVPREKVEKIKELYQDHSNKEICEIAGVSEETVHSQAARWNLRKSPEYLRQRYDRTRKMMTGRKLSKESRNKLRDSIRKLRRRELRKALAGEPQKTKLRVLGIPRAVTMRKITLVHYRGYIKTTDPYLMWYDNNTRRDSLCFKGREDYMAQKYHLRFEPAPGTLNEQSQE